MNTGSLVEMGRQIAEKEEDDRRWLETAPSYEEVLSRKLEHTTIFSMLYDLIGDTTSGMGVKWYRPTGIEES